MLTKVKQLLSPPVFEDEEKNRTAGLLNTILLSFITVIAIVTVTFLVIDSDLTRFSAVFLMLWGGLAAYTAMRLKYLQAASYIILLSVWAIITFYLIRIGGVRMPGFTLYLVLMFIGGILLGVRGVITFTLLGMVSGGAILFVELNGLLDITYEEFGLGATGAWVTQMALLVLAAVLFYQTTHSITTLLLRTRQNERELLESNRQLQTIRSSLEEQVAARTQGLEIVATLSERLNAILNVDQLLLELVNRVKENFGYYHAHIYLLDRTRENLVMTAGAGEAGRQMKAAGHRIPLQAQTSLVAHAARSNQVTIVDNVREQPDWLSNDLLPATASEMVVPIVVDAQVVGILDVQSDEIAGFDEADANVLRSLANQISVAIRNARLFAETDAARAEAEAAQSRYLSQAWGRTQADSQLGHYRRQGAPEPDRGEIEQLLQLAQQQERADVAPADKPAIVAPIRLQNQIIGAMEFQEADPEQRQTYTEQELAFVQAIADQVAQTAENLRLFEETRQRATQEQTIRRITEKMRAAPNLKRLVEIATEELGERLAAKYTKLELGFQKSWNNGNGQQE